MYKIIVKAISTWRELDVELFNDLDIGVEIQDFVEPNLNKEELGGIIKYYNEKLGQVRGLKTMHGPFLDLKPSSPDMMIREVSRMKYRATLQIASILKIDHIIFHSQINPYLNQPYLRKLNNSQAKEFWDGLLEDVNEYKGTILIENIFEETPEMLYELITHLNHERIKINLDIGHANLGKVGLEEWIRILRDYIHYIHIHSNNGEYDEHKPPNENQLNELKELLEKYHINPILSLEYKTDDLKNCIKKYEIFR